MRLASALPREAVNQAGTFQSLKSTLEVGK
jgi:hypothetical protein